MGDLKKNISEKKESIVIEPDEFKNMVLAKVGKGLKNVVTEAFNG